MWQISNVSPVEHNALSELRSNVHWCIGPSETRLAGVDEDWLLSGVLEVLILLRGPQRMCVCNPRAFNLYAGRVLESSEVFVGLSSH